MKSLTLTSRGVSVPKNEISLEQLELIKKELTVTPISPMSNVIGKPTSYSIFRQSASKIYIPKYYAIKYFKQPLKKIKNTGEDIQLEFQGTLRDEQKEPVNAVIDACKDPLKMGGILNVFCGGGKTTMALYCITKLSKKTLIIVHKDFLLNQWEERIRFFVPSARIGTIKGKTIDIEDKDIVIGSLQSISIKDYDVDAFNSFGTVVIDEVHHTSAEIFNKALFKISAVYTIGLTATLERKDGLSKIFMWHLGDVLYRSVQRVDKVEVHAYMIKNNDDPLYSEEEYLGVFSSNLNFSKMVNNVCSYPPRTKKIAEIILGIEENKKVLVLSDRIQQLKDIMEIVEPKKNCGIYIGGMNSKTLKNYDDKQVIFATFAIASEGYDQKNLDTLVLASPKSDVVQSVGRILRDRPEDRKYTPLVIDIVDKFSIFERQWYKRKKYYNDQNYNIIKNDVQHL